MQNLATIGIATDIGGNHSGCNHGPAVVRGSALLKQVLANSGLRLDWKGILRPDRGQQPIARLRELTARIASHTEKLVRERRPFLACGGDHSEAMGVWRGVLSGVPDPRSFGLIWVDAHMDANNFSTSPSGNIHGMPLAALLGNPDPRLQRIIGPCPHLNPELVVLIGVRSHQPEEAAFLKQLGVHVVSMDALGDGPGQAQAIEQAMQQVISRSAYYGVSIDLDGIDPIDAPAVGTPEPGGIRLAALCAALAIVNGDPCCSGIEIAEFLPLLDQQQRTERAIGQLVLAAFSASSRTGLSGRPGREPAPVPHLYPTHRKYGKPA